MRVIPGLLAVAIGLETSRAALQPPEPVARADVEAALAKAGPAAPSSTPLRIVLLADRKDHGPGAHDYPLWQERWSRLLGGATASGALSRTAPGSSLQRPDVRATTGTGGPGSVPAGAADAGVECATGWPADAQFASADVLAVFCYIGWTDERKAQIRRFQQRGGGLVLIHSATWTKPKPDAGVAALAGVGGFTRYRHGVVQLEIVAADHPVCAGLPRAVVLHDEPYWPPTPAPAAGRVAALAVSREAGPDGVPPSPQPMVWTYENEGGRVFGCVPGHFSWTFDDPWYRLLLLRGIAWAGRSDPRRFDSLVLEGARVK